MVPIITTLAFVQCILFATQLLVYAIQYKTNKSFRGFWWWIAGTFFMAIGIGFMPFVNPL